MEYGWLNSGVVSSHCVSPKWVCDTYQEFYRPFYFIRQQGLSLFLLAGHQIPRYCFTKRSGHYFWKIVEVIFEIGNTFNLISCYFLLFVFNFFNFIALSLFNCFASVLFNFFARVFLNTPIYLIFLVSIRLAIFITPIFIFCGIILILSTVMFATFSKCAVLCSGYAVFPSNYLQQLSIYTGRSQFMERISFISEFYISKISFILLIVVSCAAHAHSYIGLNKCLPHSYI